MKKLFSLTTIAFSALLGPAAAQGPFTVQPGAPGTPIFELNAPSVGPIQPTVCIRITPKTEPLIVVRTLTIKGKPTHELMGTFIEKACFIHDRHTVEKVELFGTAPGGAVSVESHRTFNNFK